MLKEPQLLELHLFMTSQLRHYVCVYLSGDIQVRKASRLLQHQQLCDKHKTLSRSSYLSQINLQKPEK